MIHRYLVGILAALLIVIALCIAPSLAFFGSPMMISGRAGGGGGPATASLSASPSSIASGASSTLTWGSTGAPSCTTPGSLGNTAIPGFTGATSGSASTGALTATTTYSVQCGPATAAATVTVTGGGGTSACNYGQTPFVGSVPAPAQMAGFTTCAYNGDYSDPFYATPSNFLDCTSSNSAVVWHIAAQYCSLQQVFDSTISKNVMQAENSHQVGGSQMGVGTWLTNTSFISFPTNFYIEITARMTAASISSVNNTGGPASMFLCQTDGVVSDSQPNAEEVDPFELYTNQNNSQFRVGNWITQGCGATPSGGHGWQSFASNNIPASCPNITTYCKYGFLITGNPTAGQQNICFFVNDTLMGDGQGGGTPTVGQCPTISPPTARFLNRWLLLFWVQVYSASGGVVQDEYVQSARVWTCFNWGPVARAPFSAATMCNGTTQSTQAVTGGTATFWH